MVGKKSDSTPLASRVGRNIAARRKQLKWTQDQLAERAGVDAETISRFERGVNLPSLPTLDRLASVLQIEIGDLVSDSAPKVTSEAETIGAWMQGLSAENRSFILKTVHDLCEHLRSK